MLEKTTRLNMLYDFYASLLTKKQKEYLELYYLEDHSLGEIADVKSVSRQAVYDNIRRTEKVLESYEHNLSLYEKFMQRKQILNTLSEAINDGASKATILQLLKQLENID